MQIQRYFPSPFTLKILSLCMVMLLLAMQLFKMLYFRLWFDDSFFASVAKNISLGRGYSVSIFTQDFPFNHGVSVGPFVILPAALLMKIFGHQYWVPSLTVILLIQLLLVAAFLVLRRHLGALAWFVALPALSMALMLTSEGVIPAQYFTAWYMMFGDIPSALFAVIAVLTACKAVTEPSSYRRLFGAGLLLGLSEYFKLLALLSVAGFAFTAALYMVWQARRARALLPLVLCLMGALVPHFFFEAVKCVTLGWQGYRQMALLNAAHIQQLGASFHFHIPDYAQWGEFACMLGATGAAALFTLYRPVRDPRYRSALLAAFALFATACLQAVWWEFFSTQNNRYLFQAAIYLAVAFALFVTLLTHHLRSNALISLGITVAFIFLHTLDASYLAYFSYVPDTAIAHQKDAAAQLQSLRAQGYVLFACGNNQELEYLMPASGNFHYCKEMPAFHQTHPAAKIALVYHYHLWPQTILEFGDSLDAHSVMAPPEIEALCPRVMLDLQPVKIKRCYAN